jgi:hypothetical protein
VDDTRMDAEHNKLPRLTIRNWTLEFKEAFKEYALKKVEPGDEINTSVPVDDLVNVDFDDLNEDERFYPDADRGYKRYQRDLKRYKVYKKTRKIYCRHYYFTWKEMLKTRCKQVWVM